MTIIRLGALLGVITLLFTVLLVAVVRQLFRLLAKSQSNLALSLFVSEAIPAWLYGTVTAVFISQAARDATAAVSLALWHTAGLCLVFCFLAALIYNSRAALVAGQYPPAVVYGFVRYDFFLYPLAVTAYFIGPKLSVGVLFGDYLLRGSEWLIDLPVLGILAIIIGLIMMAVMLWMGGKELLYHVSRGSRA